MRRRSYPSLTQAAGGVVGGGAVSALTSGGFLPGALGSLAGQYVGPLLFPGRPRRASKWGNVIGASGATLLAGGGLLPAAVVGLGAYGGQQVAQGLIDRRQQRRPSRMLSYECASCGHPQHRDRSGVSTTSTTTTGRVAPSARPRTTRHGSGRVSPTTTTTGQKR